MRHRHAKPDFTSLVAMPRKLRWNVMAHTQHPHSEHMHSGRDQYQLQDQLPFDSDEGHVLHIARLFFISFHYPTSQAWMPAIFTAEKLFDCPQGATIAARVLQVVNTVRFVRSAGFSYCDPACPDCAKYITKEERYLVAALHSARRGRMSDVRTQAMLLCQGGDHAPFLAALGLLVTCLETEVCP